jgi:hypothetical protein
MSIYKKFGIALASGTLSLIALNYQSLPVQAASLTQTFTVNLDSQPLNSSTNIVLPKFNSLLGTLLKAYVTVSSTVNSSTSITALGSNFTGTATTDAQIAINLPQLKADPFLALSLFASPPETNIASGGTKTVSGTASGTNSKSFNQSEILSALSGCAGDYITFGVGTTGSVLVRGTPGRGTFGGQVLTNQTISVAYEYEPVPEPTTMAGFGLAAGLGCWWKKRRQTNK